MMLNNKKVFSLEKKFTLLVVPLILLVAITLSVVVLELNQKYMLKEFNDNGKVIIETHRSVIENLLWSFEYEDLEGILSIIISHPDVSSAVVFGPEGQVLSQLGNNEGQNVKTIRTGLNYITNSRIIPLGQFEFSYSDSRLNQIFRERLKNSTLLIVLFTILVILVSLMANRILVSRPLKKLQARMADYQIDGELVKAEINTNDEIGLLASEYNTLVDIINEKQQAMKHMATHDMLTGLPTRMLCQEHLSFAIANAVRHRNKVAVMFVDLDGFKAVNDTLGHEAGDELLQKVANAMLYKVRGNDIIARFGGDEFVIVLTDLNDENSVVKVARNILHSLSKEFKLTQGTAHIGASIGIAMYPDHAEDLESLIQAADMAMYVVKKKGKNAYAFAD